MEVKIHNGDYIPDGLGGVVRCQGTEALLERVLLDRKSTRLNSSH